MVNNLLSNNGEHKPQAPDEAQRAASLVYLKDALVKEEYEDCALLVKRAKRFGARQNEIDDVVAEAVKALRKFRPYQVSARAGGIKRF